MSGSFGIPPGTRWLQSGSGRRRRREPATKKQQQQDVSQDQPMLMPVAARKDVNQYAVGMLPNGNWNTYHSPPESDQWEAINPEGFLGYDDVFDALNSIGTLRQVFGDEE